MKSLRLESIGRLSLVDTPVPDVSEGSVLLRVSHCALCRTDAKMWSVGHRDLILPRTPGHEICGFLERTGERFVVWPGRSCGVCPHCLRDAENLCPEMRILGFHEDGGLAEYALVPESSLIPVPASLPSGVACLAEPLACAVNALEQLKASPGESILIFGAGPVGLLIALAAASRGAFPWIAEVNDHKLERSETFRGRLGIQTRKSAGAASFDLAVNAAPSIETFAEGIADLKPGGRFCLFSGFPAGAVETSALNEIHYRQLQAVGAYGCTRRQTAFALSILLERLEEVRLLVDGFITLEHAPRALPEILSGAAMKYIVEL